MQNWGHKAKEHFSRRATESRVNTSSQSYRATTVVARAHSSASSWNIEDIILSNKSLRSCMVEVLDAVGELFCFGDQCGT